jgi:hypothetical protein
MFFGKVFGRKDLFRRALFNQEGATFYQLFLFDYG